MRNGHFFVVTLKTKLTPNNPRAAHHHEAALYDLYSADISPPAAKIPPPIRCMFIAHTYIINFGGARLLVIPNNSLDYKHQFFIIINILYGCGGNLNTLTSPRAWYLISISGIYYESTLERSYIVHCLASTHMVSYTIIILRLMLMLFILI